MTTLPNLSLVLPTRGAPGAGIWDDTLDADLALIDAHNHTAGKGVAVPTAGININADLSFGSAFGLTNAQRIQFASVTALSSNNKSLFVNAADNELYWRSNAGSNVKLTAGAALNVAAFTGGFGGDYAAVGAVAAFDDAGDRYTFKQQSPFNWARLASGEVRIFETGTLDTVFVGLAAPAALAASFTITLPLALPAATRMLSMDSAGNVTAGDKHGLRTKNLNYVSQAVGASVFPGVATVGLTGGTTGAQIMIPLDVGERILALRVKVVDSATGPSRLQFGFASGTLGGAVSTIATSAASAGNGTLQPLTLTGLTTTVAIGVAYWIYVTYNSGAANCSFGNVEVDYDLP